MLRILTVFVLISSWGFSASAVERPNIVLIVVDDLGAHDLGCYGSKFHRTPRLDMLAEEGIRFTQAYAACPVCSPTRAALMTGKAPPRTGITDWLPGRADRPDQRLNRPALRQQLAAEETTIAERLKAAGYATASIGKWHLGGAGSLPLEHGFDLNIAGDQTGTPLKYFAPFRGGKPGEPGRYMPGLETAPDGEYLTDRLGEEAARFIAANAKRPFFLYLPHYGVHTPMQAPEKLTKSYDNEGRTPGTSQQNPIYAAMLESVDWAVGRVVDELDNQNLTDRTIVLFTSDNGGLSVIEGPNTPPTTNAPLREGKGFLYEGGLRVPLIVRGAGIRRPARKCDVPVWSCDLPVTIAALAGIPPLDAAATAELDGVDLAPLFTAAGPLDRDALYWHYPHYSNQGGKPGAAVRIGDWKLIEFYENGRRELFDLAEDPRESRNLAVDRPEIVEQLSARLEAWRQATGALRPTPNPQYTPNPQAANGTIALPGRFAEVHGVQLRFEPAPHKNTLGFWTNPADFATWEFTVERPGRFDVEILQGCGKGQGGSVVDVTIEDANGVLRAGPVSLTVEDTGHFQNFVPRSVGTIALPEAGRYVLTLKPRSKKAAAVMDVREIVLRPIADRANAVDPARVQAIAAAFDAVDTNVLGDAADELREAARRETRTLLQASNRRETAAWHSLKSRADWERYRDERLAALRRTLRPWPGPEQKSPSGPRVEYEVTHRIEGDGFVIENLLFASQSGVAAAANLYRPSTAKHPCPAIVICHSHHAPKTQGELQTMGMTWARQGAFVLVMDQLGHGERRTHRFTEAAAYPSSFRPERQDYYFRYNTGVQLHLLGESLVGCIVADLLRGVDLLALLPEVDAQRIVMLGAVAGGGDPVGIAAALDPRIAVAAPFNFGGYEPEDVFPLPENAEETFDFSGSGSWESTRNLRLSARDGFQPWSIVAATAPRHLIYAHEFRWDEPRDPVWRRLQKVFAWYDAPERLSFVVGRGNVKGRPPEATHCTNIGAVHRSQLYPLLEKWIGLPPPKAEYAMSRSREELGCVRDGRRLTPLHEALQQRTEIALRNNGPKDAAAMRKALAETLGSIEPSADAQPTILDTKENSVGFVVERVRLERRRHDVEQPIPLLVVRPTETTRKGSVKPQPPLRIVVGLGQVGKQTFWQERRETIAAVVATGAWVVLPDLYATGEMQPRDDGRGRTSSAASRSASLWMLGETALGRRVCDVRTVLAYLRSRTPGVRFTLWGEGFAAANPAGVDLAAPLDAEKLPTLAEPLGAHAAILAALWESDVDAVYAAGGLVGYRSLLEQPYFYVPHDCLVPSVLEIGDVPQWATALESPRVRFVDCRDGLNRRVPIDAVRRSFGGDAGGRITMAETESSPAAAAAWMTGE